MKYIIAAFLLSGCASFQMPYEKNAADPNYKPEPHNYVRVRDAYAETCESFVGHKADDLIDAWGIPSQEYKKDNGGRVFTYYQGAGAVASSFNNISVARSRYCKTTFYIDPVGLIEKYAYEGNACR